MKIEVEVSEVDVDLLKEILNVEDISKLLATFLQEVCRLVREAKLLDKAGIGITETDIDKAGIEITKRMIESARR